MVPQYLLVSEKGKVLKISSGLSWRHGDLLVVPAKLRLWGMTVIRQSILEEGAEQFMYDRWSELTYNCRMRFVECVSVFCINKIKVIQARHIFIVLWWFSLHHYFLAFSFLPRWFHDRNTNSEVHRKFLIYFVQLGGIGHMLKKKSANLLLRSQALSLEPHSNSTLCLVIVRLGGSNSARCLSSSHSARRRRDQKKNFFMVWINTMAL